MATAAHPTMEGLRRPESKHAFSMALVGWSLSVFFVISYVLCVLGYYLLPSLPIAHGALAIPLPGFQFDSWPRFFLGVVESFAWGWYIALVYGSIYNFFAGRFR